LKNNPTTVLKVPEGLIKRANGLGLLSDIVFWYQLKSLNIEGKIVKGNIEKTLSVKFGYSIPSIWRKIKNLEELSWIKKEDSEYKLISYDLLFLKLGYIYKSEINYKFYNKLITKDKKPKFKIYKIPTININYFFEHVAYEDIKHNFKKQAYTIIHTIKTNSHLPIYQSIIQKNLLNKVKLNDIKSFELLNQHIIENRESEEYWDKTSECDITLSCQGLANLLGYSSSQTGYNIQNKLEDLGLLKIEKRKILLDANIFLAPNTRKEVSNGSPKFVLTNYGLYYYNTNKLHIIL
jgi:hypothetical protein